MPRHVERPRLLSRLDTCLAPGIVWIQGPPGAGKSCLAADFASRRGHIVLWVGSGLEEGDFSGVVASLASALSAVLHTKDLPEYSEAWVGSATEFGVRWANAAVAQLHPDADAVLVIDDLVLAQGSSLSAALSETLAVLATRLPTLVTSQYMPDAAWFSLIASGTMQVIDGDALRFNDEEIMNLLIAMDRPAMEARQLAAITDGWAAAVSLAVAMPAAMLEADRDAAATLSAQLLARILDTVLSGHQLLWLWNIHLLPAVDEDLAVALTGSVEVVDLLRDLCTKGLFVRKPPPHQQFVLHTLLREAIVLSVPHAGTGAALEALRQQTGAALVARRDYAAALTVANIGGPGAAVALLEDLADALLRAGRYQLLREWGLRIGISRFSAAPQAASAIGFSLAMEGAPEASLWFDLAWRAANHETQSGCAQRIAALVMLAHDKGQSAVLCDRQWVVRLSDGLARVVAEGAEPEPLLVVAVLLARAWGFNIDSSLLDTAAAVPALRAQCESPGWVPGDIVYMVAASAVLDWLHSTGSDFAQAEGFVALVEASPQYCAASVELRCAWACELAQFRRYHGDQTGFLSMLDRAQGLAAQLPHGPVSSYVSYLRGLVLLDRGRVDLALGELETVLPVQLARPSRTLPWLLKLKARCLIARRQHHEALAAAREATAVAASFGVSESIQTNFRMEEVFAAVAQRHYAEAAAVCRACSGLLTGSLQTYWAACADAIDALDRTRAPHARAESVRKAFAGFRSCGSPAYFAMLPAVAAELSALALEDSVEVAFVREAVLARGLRAPAGAGPTWPWRIRVHCIAGLLIEISGQALALSPKTPRKLITLLLMLSVSPRQRMESAALTEALWPEAHGKKSLEMAVARLRELLGVPEAVRVSGGRVSLDDGMVFSEFAGVRKRLQVLAGAGAPPVAGDSMAFLLDHPPPNFADAEPCSVLLGAAEQYRAEWVSAVCAVAAGPAAAPHSDSAAALLERALVIEPGEATLWRKRIELLLQENRRHDALLLYRRCRQMFSVLFGCEPPEELRRIAASHLTSTP